MSRETFKIINVKTAPPRRGSQKLIEVWFTENL